MKLHMYQFPELISTELDSVLIALSLFIERLMAFVQLSVCCVLSELVSVLFILFQVFMMQPCRLIGLMAIAMRVGTSPFSNMVPTQGAEALLPEPSNNASDSPAAQCDRDKGCGHNNTNACDIITDVKEELQELQIVYNSTHDLTRFEDDPIHNTTTSVLVLLCVRGRTACSWMPLSFLPASSL